MKILHVKDVAYVGKSLVSGLNKIGETAELYETIKYKKRNFPRIINRMIGSIIAFIELCRFSFYINLNHFDIVHVHFGSVAYLALFNRIPFYLHLHGTDLRKGIHIPITGFYIKKGIKKAEKVFFSTPDLEELIKPLRPDAIFFPNPIETDKFIPEKKASATTLIDIFSISKIDKNKGVETILSSIENLIDDDFVSKVLMFGIGNESIKYAQELDNLRSSNKMEIIGQVEHDKMVQLINNSKIILGQMNIGSIGCSELEAMACGKPVVCKFSYGSMYTTPPPVVHASTAEEAKIKIIELLHDPLKIKNIGAASRKWVEVNSNNEIIAQKLLDYYKTSDH